MRPDLAAILRVGGIFVQQAVMPRQVLNRVDCFDLALAGRR
jgi:hypothetical protein